LTLKGQKNHYNIKFLKGYGHSISVNNSKIVLKSNHDPFSEPEKEEWFEELRDVNDGKMIDSMSLNPEFFPERFELNSSEKAQNAQR